MHISLDQALGRQPRLNRVGDKLLQIAGGASAAYSLRSLTGNFGNAVRIRRAEDNVEVNVGFDGSGAVSTTSPITNVSDEPISSLSIGTAWSQVAGAAGYFASTPLTVGGTYATPFKARVSLGETVVSGSKVNLAGNVSSITGSNWVIYPAQSDNSIAVSSGTSITSTGVFITSFTLTADAQYVIIENTSGTENITLSGAVTGSKSAGDTAATTLGAFISEASSPPDMHVVTWYDQSGNGNDVTQSALASQPKIVDYGILLDGAKFLGTDDYLQALGVTEITGPAISMFIVSERTSSGTTVSLNKETAGNLFMVARDDGTSAQMAIRNTTNNIIGDSISGNSRLSFLATAGNADYKVGANGTAVTNGVVSYGDDFESGDLNAVLIGARRPTSLYDFYTGLVKEVIIYNSDQTSNRTAIEANINNYHSVY